jgi:hypothetical protein
MAYNETLATRVRGWALQHPGVEEKAMFGGLCFLVGGHMLGGVKGDNVLVRLGPSGDVHRGKPHVLPFPTAEKSMPGFFQLELPLVKTEPALAKWLESARAFAASLPPKPGKGPVAKSSKKPAAKKPAASKPAPKKRK